MRFKQTLVALVLGLCLIPGMGSGATPAVAEGTTADFGVRPQPGTDPATTQHGYFHYELKPGKRARGQVLVSNLGSTAMTINAAAADAQTSGAGGSAFATSEEPPASVGAWLSLESDQVEIQPGQDILVDFTVRVPKHTQPGQYLAGIAAYVKEPARPAAETESAAGAAVILQTRYVIGVQIDVPGKWIPSLKVAGVRFIEQPSGSLIGIDMRNDGAMFLRPKGMLVITAADGSVVLEQKIEMGTFVTGTETTYPVPWPESLEPGQYHAHVELEYATGRTVTYDSDLQVGTMSTSTAGAQPVATR